MVQPTAHGGLESLSFNIDDGWLSPSPADFQAVYAIIRNSAKSKLKAVDVTLSMNGNYSSTPGYRGGIR
ncbi:hypothetical protein CPC08DRAFT_714685 [Agrocybe pediades]|nr:hypothetical protein CPC08DRAFT_714685 [Agrocybe pediades]